MPCITVDLNGNRIATIGLAGLQLVDVSVFGALDQEQKAILGAGGGNFSEGGCGYLIWIAERDLQPGDVVNVSLNEACDSADRGKTIDELYPDAEPSDKTDFRITEEMAAELRARPRLHEAFIVQAGTSSGQHAKAASDDRNTHFRFGFLWDNLHPEQARVGLRTHCLDDVLARTGGSRHLQTKIAMGGSASFSLVA